MTGLGHDSFHVAGHDRGARVAYRLAFDHPDRVSRLALLDILPTAATWDLMVGTAGLGAYHWYFLAQPSGLPETLIGNDPAFFRKIACPVLLLWGEHGGIPGELFVQAWRDWADDVDGHGLPCGHFLPEEAPDETLDALRGFFSSADDG